MEEDNPLGLGYTPTVGDAFEGAVNYLGGVARFYQKTVPQFFTGVRRAIKEEAEAPVTPTTGVESITQLPQEYARTESRFLEQVASGAESIGLPEPVAGFAALGASAIYPGLAEMSLVTKGGAATLMGLTATRADLLAPGIKQGVAKTDNYKFGIAKLRAQGAADAKRVEDYMTQFATGDLTRDQLTERLAKVKKRGDAKYSTLARLDDPDIFEKPRFQNVDPTNPAVKADQHHAATKAMTTPWVRKALEIGDDDDVVALFELHRMLTGSGMGNVRSGIIDIPGVVHDTAKATRAGRDPSQAIHSFMKKKGAGIEIRTDAVEKIVGDPKNMDELLDKYVTFANEYLIPQKELSLKALDKELTRHRSTLSGSALEQFDKLVSKLNRANT